MQGAEQPDAGQASPPAVRTDRPAGTPSAPAARPAPSAPAARPAPSAPAARPAAPPLIAVDAMGGDHAPDEIVAGAVAAAREHGIRVALTGRPGLLRPLLARHGAA